MMAFVADANVKIIGQSFAQRLSVRTDTFLLQCGVGVHDKDRWCQGDRVTSIPFVLVALEALFQSCRCFLLFFLKCFFVCLEFGVEVEFFAIGRQFVERIGLREFALMPAFVGEVAPRCHWMSLRVAFDRRSVGGGGGGRQGGGRRGEYGQV